MDLPASAGSGLFGIVRVIDLAPAVGGRFQKVTGDSYIAAIEFSNPVRAKVLTTYGNANLPGSPHISEQLPLYTRNELRPICVPARKSKLTWNLEGFLISDTSLTPGHNKGKFSGISRLQLFFRSAL